MECGIVVVCVVIVIVVLGRVPIQGVVIIGIKIPIVRSRSGVVIVVFPVLILSRIFSSVTIVFGIVTIDFRRSAIQLTCVWLVLA